MGSWPGEPDRDPLLVPEPRGVRLAMSNDEFPCGTPECNSMLVPGGLSKYQGMAPLLVAFP